MLHSPKYLPLSSMNEGSVECKRALGFHWRSKYVASLSALRSKANKTRETQDGDENQWAEESEIL